MYINSILNNPCVLNSCVGGMRVAFEYQVTSIDFDRDIVISLTFINLDFAITIRFHLIIVLKQGIVLG